MLRSSNPALNPFQTGGTVQQPTQWTQLAGGAAPGTAAIPAARPGMMTLGGTLTASAILIGLTMFSALGSWSLIQTSQGLALPLGIGGMVVALICSLVLMFAHKAAPFVAPIYAIAKGAFVGWISLVVATRIPGNNMEALPFQALILTMAVAGGMLVGYATRIIRPGRIFRAVVTAGILGYVLFGLLALVLMLIGNNSLISLFSFTNNSPISIGLSVVVVALASLALILDFEMIENGIRSGQPKYMEWYAGWALLVTLIWLYLEILRLLSKLRR
ncbi:MAG: Bax inhibitor-1/YccA family protein [Phycisphaerales bacterium]